MKLTSAVRLLRLLPSRQEDALNVKQIVERWQEVTATEIHLRSVQRYMGELSADSADGPALVDIDEDGRERRYYLRLSQVAQWFMTEATSLDLLLARQVLLRSFGPVNPAETKNLYAMAEKLTADSVRNRRLHDRLRVVPDGIGRQRAKITPEVLASSMDAIAAGQKLGFSYFKSNGKESKHVRTPLGLVAKDGTIYLLATMGLSDVPRHFALHRFSDAYVVPELAQTRTDIDLDRYIAESQQFSHVLDTSSADLQLELRVAPESIWHFRERPFPEQAPIGQPGKPGDWFTVLATVPDTVLLVPFLVSMGPYIKVIGPESVRGKVVGWLREASAHYVRSGEV